MKTERSVRLNPVGTTILGNTAATNGEIFYDQTHKTLRLFDGRTKGGFQLLRADLANIAGSLGAIVSDTPPTNAQKGAQWLNSTNGVLYMYFVNSDGTGHWFQPVTSPIGTLTPTVSLPVASLFSLGAVKVDGSSIVVGNDGTISAVYANSFNNSNFVGITTTSINATQTNTISGAIGFVQHDIAASGTVFYHNSVAGDFSANFVNVPTTNNRTITITLIIAQNNPAFIANSVFINGTGQTINWEGGVIPTGTIGNTDVMTFLLVRSNNMWTVYGSLSTHGA